MAKKTKSSEMNLYYMKNGQAPKETIEDVVKRKQTKEREKRIKQNKKQEGTGFDLETETVIQMTNRNKLKQEEAKRKELTRKEQKRKKRNKRIKHIVELVVLLGIIIGGTIFAMTSPIFNIKDIQVLNNSQVSGQTIISLSGLKQEDNLFRFQMGKTVQQIKENAYIESVKIHRKIPSTIQIEVQERTAKYAVDFMGKYAYCDAQGYLLEIGEEAKNLPIIQGTNTSEEEMTPGKRLNNTDLEKLEDMMKIINLTKENNLDAKVTSIDITNKSDYSIYLEEEQKRIHLGDTANLANKMLYVVAIMEQEKGKAGDIYANGDFNNKFQPYFKEKV